MIMTATTGSASLLPRFRSRLGTALAGPPFVVVTGAPALWLHGLADTSLQRACFSSRPHAAIPPSATSWDFLAGRARNAVVGL